MGDTKTRKKTRSDKKHDIKPTVQIELKTCIERLSFITDTPVQYVLENICEYGVNSRKVLEELSAYFQRTARFRSTLFMGSLDNLKVERRDSGHTQRVHTRFTQETFENIHTLAYALCVTPSRATAILLKTTILCTGFMDVYVRSYLNENLDADRMKELKQVIRYINLNNNEEEHFSWFVFLSNFIDDIKDKGSSVSDSIVDFLDKWRNL